VIVLGSDTPNIYPINDPIGAVVWGMDTSNVDSVFVAGKALKRDGELVGIDLTRVSALAYSARDHVAANAGLEPLTLEAVG
jgi:cytosine/adenosine deaminase-related metal-dependent hydrolase